MIAIFLLPATLITLISCQAATVVDVDAPFGGSKDRYSSFGQIFTPIISGNLDGLRLLIASSAPSFTVTIWEFDASTGKLQNILGTKAISSSTVFQNYRWAEVTFSSKIQQTAGIPMAFTILAGTGFWGPAISSGSSYSGGSFFEYSGDNSIVLTNRDLTFQTLITPVPEAGPTLLMVFTIAICGMARKRSAKMIKSPAS